MDAGLAVQFLVGATVLVVGAELLVRGASRLAARTGLSSVVIGLTVVATGTSAPEFAVNAQAAMRGEGDLAVGNVVGSNILNVLLVLGLSATITALVVAQRVVRYDVPIMIGASVVVALVVIGGTISRLEGLLMFAAFVGYLVWTVRSARREPPEIVAEYDEGLGDELLRRTPLGLDLGFIVVGLALLVVGARLLVAAATDIATALGVSELLIGLTVVAIGTATPEIATSIVAIIRGDTDLAVGNVVGSNIVNALGVLGVSGIVASGGLPVGNRVLTFDIPVMIGVAIACLPIFFNGFVVKRWEGILFLGFYAAYVAYLVLDAMDSGARRPFAVWMLGLVLPLTAVVLVVIGLRAWRGYRTPAADDATT